MKQLFKKYGYLLWFALFGAVGPAYFVISHLPLTFRDVHAVADDVIPFLPIFILPYIVWYLYVPGILLWIALRQKQNFGRAIAELFGGILFCFVIFVVFPTSISFRPSAEGNGILLWLCRIVYSNDLPRNVFPSLHVFEAMIVHVCAFWCPEGKGHTGFRITSAAVMILIILSTVFVKQHSVWDVLGGIIVTLIVWGIGKAVQYLKSH